MQILTSYAVEEYLSANYELLREDAIRPLREAVQQVKITPQAEEAALNGSIGIYEKVRYQLFSVSWPRLHANRCTGAHLLHQVLTERHRYQSHFLTFPDWQEDFVGAVKAPNHWWPRCPHAGK